ncbi:MAG: LysE family translocator [Muribaculaceae bacterium]|nr:LysE family translocator [Muribaculaceae bacterium]
MEELVYMILRGLIIGVVVSAPMGPVGIYCIQRTLDKGRLSGFYTGVGAAVSDLIYCLLTGFGLSFIEEFISNHRYPIQLLGSIVLIFFGIWLIRKTPDGQIAADADHGAPSREGDILKGFALTFSNPLILFLIIGLFAQFNFVIEGIRFYHYVLGFIGIIGGALGWWWIVTYFVDKLRGHFTRRTMKRINMAIGIIILVFAAVGIFSSASSLIAAPAAPVAVKGDLRSAEFRVADTALKGWRAEFACDDEVSIVVEVTPVSKKDPFGDSSIDVLGVRVLEFPSGSVLGETVISDGIDPYRGKNSWRLIRAADRWNLFAGNREYHHVIGFESPHVPVGDPALIPNTPGGIMASVGNVESAPIEDSDISEADILYALSREETGVIGLSGLYSLLDFEQDDTYARIGGSYRLAVVPADAGKEGEYIIYYLGGARENASCWAPGMKKGRLAPTPFVNVYDVEWRDAEGVWMHHDVQAEFDQLAHTLTVKFPYQGSSMRFRKE